ncbi:hypothetical protein MTP04_30160 [Lysinibacillus sp. PLM2]|nr:hypothetical protein MTP04_30160 [Lysinibacillus sp. PLM2]
MSFVEALLVYSPKRLGENESQIVIGKTSNPLLIKQLSECIIADAKKEVEMWKSIDPAVATMCNSEVKRLTSIISMFTHESYANGNGTIVPFTNENKK